MEPDEDDDVGNFGMKRRRGGIQQGRVKAKEDAKANRTEQSQLFLFLMHSWSWGLLPATLVQQVAMLALEDIENERKGLLKPEDLEKMGKLGHSGGDKGHCHADLMKLADHIDLPVWPKPGQIELPIFEKGEPGFKLAMQGIFWPHEMFAHIYKNAQPFFRRNI